MPRSPWEGGPLGRIATAGCGYQGRLPQLFWLVVWSAILLQAHAEVFPPRANKKIVVCTAPFSPMVECEPGGEPEEFKGYDIEQMRTLARRIDWKPSNYTFKCFSNFSLILDDLRKDEGSECDIAAAAITRNTEREKEGIQFTYPTYRSSLAVMVKASVREGSYWGFLRPLHWSVWLATILTTLAVPWIVFVIESLACHGFVHKGDWIPGIKEATWHSVVALVSFGHFNVRSTAARIVVMGYGFLVLIIINTYVANLAAFLTITQVDTSISSVDDLAGHRVATVETYAERLESRGIIPIVHEQVGYHSSLVEELRNGRPKIQAVLMDEPWVTFTVSNSNNCDLQRLPETLIPFDYAFAFPKSANRSIVTRCSKEILEMQEDGESNELIEKFIHLPTSGCPVDNEISETRSVKFYQVLGLWLILGVCITFAILLLGRNLQQYVPVALWEALTFRRFRERHNLTLGPPKRVSTVYHRKASDQLKASASKTLQYRELKGRIDEVQEAVQRLTEEIRCLGDNSGNDEHGQDQGIHGDYMSSQEIYYTDGRDDSVRQGSVGVVGMGNPTGLRLP